VTNRGVKEEEKIETFEFFVLFFSDYSSSRHEFERGEKNREEGNKK
jgi:hypothetical protein